MAQAHDQLVARAQTSMLRAGWSLIRRQLQRAPRQFALGLVGTTIYAGATVVSSLVIGWVTDELLFPAVERGDVTTGALAVAAIAVIGVSAVKAVGIALRRGGAYAAQYRLQQRDRQDITDTYLRLPTEWHRRHPTGQLLANVNDDVEAASFIAAPLPMAFGVIVMLIVTAVLLVSTDPFLALIGFLVGPMLAFANYLFQQRMRVVAADAQRLRAEVSETAHESFDAALVVKTLGREGIEADRFGGVSDDLRDRMIHIGRLRAVFDPVLEALPNVGILLVLMVGARRVAAGAITPGELVTFAFLFRLVALPMRVFGFLLGQIPAAVVGMERIESVLGQDGAIRYGERDGSAAGGADARAEGVRYTYETTTVEDLGAPLAPRTSSGAAGAGAPGTGAAAADVAAAGVGAAGVASADVAEGAGARGVEAVDLQVAPGQTLAIVGPTGSGKTTVAHLMARLFDPQDGRITIDGDPLGELRRDRLADSVALVFQDAFLFDDDIRTNLTLGRDIPDEEVRWAARLAQADHFISQLSDGYATQVGERGASLSGGQRQRIALARAILRRPRLLVLDDATSAVDPAVEAAILEGLAELDTSVVLIAYRRSSIALADEVVYVEAGRVVGRGSSEELYASHAGYRALIDAYDTTGDTAGDTTGEGDQDTGGERVHDKAGRRREGER